MNSYYTFEQLQGALYRLIIKDSKNEKDLYREQVQRALAVLRLPLSEELGIKLALEELNKVG